MVKRFRNVKEELVECEMIWKKSKLNSENMENIEERQVD
jgi:hypothetical protein